MPTYDYRCETCGYETTALRKIEDRLDAPECHGQMKQIIKSIRAYGDLEPYYDDNLETHIESRQHRQRVLKDKGLSELYGQGWT